MDKFSLKKWSAKFLTFRFLQITNRRHLIFGGPVNRVLYDIPNLGQKSQSNMLPFLVVWNVIYGMNLQNERMLFVLLRFSFTDPSKLDGKLFQIVLDVLD